MTLPASGILKLSDIAAEFGYGNALSGYVGKTWYTDAGATGTFAATLKLSDFHSKRKTAPVFKFSVTSNVNKAVMSTLAYNAGWDGSLPLECTINSGVTVYSDTPSFLALWINVPCLLINKGLILGGSGAGGKGGTIHGTQGDVPLVGGAGGAAMGVDAYISVDNQGVICGGAGGGGGGGSMRYSHKIPDGTGGYVGYVYACGGGGGGAGPSGAPGAGGTTVWGSGISARRDGSAGAASGYYYATGAGGNGGYAEGPNRWAGSGGASGSYASAGATGTDPNTSGSSSSQWSSAGRAGGAGGAAVTNNAYITWINTGTRYGAIT